MAETVQTRPEVLDDVAKRVAKEVDALRAPLSAPAPLMPAEWLASSQLAEAHTKSTEQVLKWRSGAVGTGLLTGQVLHTASQHLDSLEGHTADEISQTFDTMMDRPPPMPSAGDATTQITAGDHAPPTVADKSAAHPGTGGYSAQPTVDSHPEQEPAVDSTTQTPRSV